MKQQLDAVRTLAIKLYEAGQKAKREQNPEIWGCDAERKWRDMPSESVAVWDAIALAASDALRIDCRQKQLRLLRAACSALHSYACGNSAPDLAASVAGEIDRYFADQNAP